MSAKALTTTPNGTLTKRFSFFSKLIGCFFKWSNGFLRKKRQMSWKRRKGPHPHTFSLLRKRPVLLRADVVLTKDPRPLYYKTPPSILPQNFPLEGHFGSFVRTKLALSKTGRSLSKTESVGVGAFSPLPNVGENLQSPVSV